MVKFIKKYQMGGAMPPVEDPAMAGAEAGAVAGAEAGAMEEAAQGGGDPVMQLVEMAMQALQAQDPQMAMAVCEGLVSLVQGAGGGAPAPGGAPGEEPVMMRKGGKLVCKKGAKMRKKRC